MKYSIVIITKDRFQNLINLVGSIDDHTLDYELIIIDDVSEDGTREWLQDKKGILGHYTNCSAYQGVSYATSIPVATAWNLGCELATGDFIQILNDDMSVTEGWIDQQYVLWNKLTKDGINVGTLASKLLRGNEVLSRGGAFRGIHLVPVSDSDEVKPISYSNNPFFKRELFKELGGFTAHANMYYEDADWGLKCLKKGYLNYYNPDSVLRHETIGFLPEHGEEQFKRRQHNESVVQQQARSSFMREWEWWLKNEHINYY